MKEVLIQIMEINLVPLVPGAVMPTAASARTRDAVPVGYGVQEQCLPFTAAAALGLLVPSPIGFGYCRRDAIPPGQRGLRSPLRGDPRTCPPDELVFYVTDDPDSRFVNNSFTYDTLRRKRASPHFSPGLSFFDREDQMDLFKLHLPYICNTEPEVDTLILAPLNRVIPFEVVSGLIETDWYANAINLILKPRSNMSEAHVAKGDVIAQMIFLSRPLRRPQVSVPSDHACLTRKLKLAMEDWLQHHALDRSAYKKLARSPHGRLAPK